MFIYRSGLKGQGLTKNPNTFWPLSVQKNFLKEKNLQIWSTKIFGLKSTSKYFGIFSFDIFAWLFRFFRLIFIQHILRVFKQFLRHGKLYVSSFISKWSYWNWYEDHKHKGMLEIFLFLDLTKIWWDLRREPKKPNSRKSRNEIFVRIPHGENEDIIPVHGLNWRFWNQRQNT